MIALIKYNAGNVSSVISALHRIGTEAKLTDDPEVIKNADKVIFPGVGEASSAMAYLKASGLDKVIKSLNKPFLGICLGLQLMCRRSEEGDVDCLGIFPNVEVKRFSESKSYKIPHVGWNTIEPSGDKLFKGIENQSYVYFVHSYYAELTDSAIASTIYDDLAFASAIKRDNFYGLQFHPEKSGEVGERILRNFLEI